jgi:hypothetical protein
MPSLTISAEPIAKAPILALKKALEKGDVRLRTDSVLVFVCGAAVKDGDYTGDGARAQFMHHAQKHLPGFRVFLAESVINALKEAPKSDLLSTEQDLACFSDCIIIIMESAGALVELGAFTAHDDLARIVLAINDVRFKDAPPESFIKAGPLRKLEHSDFGAPIYADFRRLFTVFPEVRSRLQRQFHFKRNRPASLRDHEQWTACQRKLRMLFVHDLVRLFGPVQHAGLIHVLCELYGNHRFDIKLELAVLRALKLVEMIEGYYVSAGASGQVFFSYPGDFVAEARSRIINRYFHVGDTQVAILQRNLTH